MELYSTDGAQLGALVISDAGQSWGLGPFFSRRGVEIGDTLILTLDTELDCAVVQHGSPELLDLYSDGEGWGPAKLFDEAIGADSME